MRGIALFAGVACLSFTSAVAQAGFFESLFGLTPASVQPSTAIAPASPQSPISGRHQASRQTGLISQHRKRYHNHPSYKGSQVAAAVVSDKPLLQRKTRLLDDRTLRVGDAVMTNDGIRIFSGAVGAHHEVKHFVALRNAQHVAKSARAILSQIDDAARSDIGRDRTPTDLQSGRSVGTAADQWRPSYADPNTSVRYVGP